MKGLREKFQKNGGFTLIEMLIVVAIIAILIAVSIPMVSGALEKARQATDAANERAAKGEITVCFMADLTYDGTNKVTKDTAYYYNIVDGKLKSTAGDTYGKCTTHKDKFIEVSIDENGEVSMAWSTSLSTGKVTAGNDLCGGKVNS